MSTEYFFRKWKEVLFRLEQLVNADTEFQKSKINDTTICLITQRLSGMLGAYITSFNELLDSYKMNAQVQKKMYIYAIIQGVIARILELKQQLSKLDGSTYQFLSHGLMIHMLTSFDVEFIDIPNRKKRSEDMKLVLEDFKEKIEEEKERIEIEQKAALAAQGEVQEDEEKNWWDDTLESESSTSCEVEKKISAETLKRWQLGNMIKAHEKSRHVVTAMQRQKLKREMWVKRLEGTAQPQARDEIKHQGAKLIQRAFRYYFELKRSKLEQCKRDAMMGYSLCKTPTREAREKNEQISALRAKKFEKLEKEWTSSCEEFKNYYFKRMADDIADDFKDKMRNWFREWFDEVLFFYDIPSEAKGGSTHILKEEVATPTEWSEQYKAFLQQNKANKNKSGEQLKKEREQAKKEAQQLKKEELMKQRKEEKILVKLMKDPKTHPGYTYPVSKKIEQLRKALENYRNDWDELDISEISDVKEGHYKKYDIQNICMEVKIEVLKKVDEHMREELKLLKKALKKDYDYNEMEMPQVIKPPRRKKKKVQKVTPVKIETVNKHLVNLGLYDLLQEYPKTMLEDFMGDPNMIGEDLRCQYKFPVTPGHAEIRNIWWEKCSELSKGFHRILLVGPKGSGRTLLVHIMASLNDAVLFKISPSLFGSEDTSTMEFIQNLFTSLIICAKALQPSVIYITDLNLIYGKKCKAATIPGVDIKGLKKLLTKKVFKGFLKSDNVTVIGTCTEPWNLKSNQLIRQLPNAILMPNTTYQTVFQILQKWVTENRQIPRDLDISSLAYVLQGYRYGFLKESLDTFLTAQRIIKIPVQGLSPMEVYDHILEDISEIKVDYEKYIKWYLDQTPWGHKEKKHARQQLEFKALIEKYADQKRKKAKQAFSALNSITSSFADLTDQTSVKTFSSTVAKADM